jgi:DNA-binding MarR family transcriptional regulator
MNNKSWLQNRESREKWMRLMQSFYPEINSNAIRLMDQLGFVSRSIYHMGGQSVDGAGLSFPQYRVLMHLYFAEEMGEHGELNPSEISHRQGVSRNTMSSFIRSLEEEGLVERRLDPNDRRRFNISLTDRGREVIRQHTHDHLVMIDHFFSALSTDEQAILLNLLRKIGSQVAAVQQDS